MCSVGSIAYVSGYSPISTPKSTSQSGGPAEFADRCLQDKTVLNAHSACGTVKMSGEVCERIMAKAATTCVDVSLFGAITVLGKGRSPIVLGIAGPTLELLAYLFTFYSRPLRRDHLADLLWQNLDEFGSRAALNTALWRVRRVVRALPGISLLSDSVNVQLVVEDNVSIDTQQMKRISHDAIAKFSKDVGLPTVLREDLRNVLTTHDHDFVEGFSSHWVLVEREEYFNLRIRGLTILMQDAGLQSHYEDALHYGRRILAADPFREAVHCQMLWLYIMTGRRANAIKHYRELEKMLQLELGIQPMAETCAMYKMICNDEPTSSIGSRLSRIEIGQTLQLPGDTHKLDEIESDRRAFYRSHFTASI
jgi:DNA-binding SARP family transcriptional activator